MFCTCSVFHVPIKAVWTFGESALPTLKTGARKPGHWTRQCWRFLLPFVVTYVSWFRGGGCATLSLPSIWESCFKRPWHRLWYMNQRHALLLIASVIVHAGCGVGASPTACSQGAKGMLNWRIPGAPKRWGFTDIFLPSGHPESSEENGFQVSWVLKKWCPYD